MEYLFKEVQKRIGDADQRKMHWSLIAPVNSGKSAFSFKIKEKLEKNPENEKLYGMPVWVPYVVAPEELTWKALSVELLYRIGIKKKQKTEITPDLGRDIEDQINNFHHEGKAKHIPLIIFDNFDKLVLEGNQDIKKILDNLLTFTQRIGITVLLVGTPDLEIALNKQPAIGNRFPPLKIMTFTEQIDEIHQNKKMNNDEKKELKKFYITELYRLLKTISFDLANGDKHNGTSWAFPDQIRPEFQFERQDIAKWFLTECKGRLGEIMQTIRLAGLDALENGEPAISFDYLIQGRMKLGPVPNYVNYQYNIKKKQKTIK